MNNPLVSVIIPLYNAEEYIEECIESVFQQTYPNIEIIVVNDGSTDSSLSVLSSIQKKRNLIIISQQNKGASAARNTGIKHAKGNYFQFLDADDKLPSNKIEEQINELRKVSFNPRNLVFCKWNTFSTKYKFVDQITHDYNTPIDLLVDFMQYSAMLIPHCYLVSKELIDIAGLWDESLSLNDDGEWFSRIIAASNKIIYSNNTTVFYRDTPNSLSKQKSLKAMRSEIIAYIKTAEIANRSNKENKNKVIYNFIKGKLIFIYPYYREYRKIGELYLRTKYPTFSFSYPTLSLKVWIFYQGVKLGILKSNLHI